MRTISFIILTLLLSCCSTDNTCENEYTFITCSDSIPILDIDITQPYDSVRQELNKLYETDLCERCGLIDFKLPLKINGKSGFIKVMTDFDSPYCVNCPAPIRNRHYYTILINSDQELLVEDEYVEVDSLKSNIYDYLKTVGKNDDAPQNFNRLNFQLDWAKGVSSDFLNYMITIIYESYLEFVQSELSSNGIKFCKLNIEELGNLKEKYPLRIELDLGKINRQMKLMEEKIKSRNANNM